MNPDIILEMIVKRFCINHFLFNIIQSEMNHIPSTSVTIEHIYINYLSIDMNLDILLQSYLWWSSRISWMTSLLIQDFHSFFPSAFSYHDSQIFSFIQYDSIKKYLSLIYYCWFNITQDDILHHITLSSSIYSKLNDRVDWRWQNSSMLFWLRNIWHWIERRLFIWIMKFIELLIYQ